MNLYIWGSTAPIVLSGTGFGNASFGTRNIVMFNGGAVHYSVNSTGGNTRISFVIDWSPTRKDHLLKCGANPVHVFDGISMSNEAVLTVQNCKGN